LEVEDVGHSAVELLSPEPGTGGQINELGGDAERLADATPRSGR
jgi:hypothetical protein